MTTADPELFAAWSGHVAPELHDVLRKLPRSTISPHQLRTGDMDAFRRREALALGSLPAVEMASVEIEDRCLSTTTEDCGRVRTYRPTKTSEPAPTIIYAHGGGFFSGSARLYDPVCARLATDLNCAVVSVDYRLAPEHPYPAALEDCFRALEWIADTGVQEGFDANRIVLAGHSAGGGLMAGLSLLAQQWRGPAIRGQVLIYPVLDNRHGTPSAKTMAQAPLWGLDLSMAAWDAYMGSQGRANGKFAAPARASDVSKLPPTYILSAGVDLLRDEGLRFAVRLIEAGVPVELFLVGNAFHAFDLVAPDTDIAKRAVAGYMDALRRALDPPARPGAAETAASPR